MKPVAIKFLKSAKLDIQHAKEWYNIQRTNLGQAFVLEVEKIYKQIENNPKQFPKV